MSADNGTKRELRDEVLSFRGLWKGGFFEGDPPGPFGFSGYSFFGFMNMLHVTYLMCIRPYVHSPVNGFGNWPGGAHGHDASWGQRSLGVWTHFQRSTTSFTNTSAHHDHVRYVQVEDFSCRSLPDNHFDYFFSFGCFCHISPAGTHEYCSDCTRS